MKTPLQELKEDITELIKKSKGSNRDDGDYRIGLDKALGLIDLEAEKNQVIDFAFDFYHYMSHKNKVPENLITENRDHAEDYFNENYNK